MEQFDNALEKVCNYMESVVVLLDGLTIDNIEASDKQLMKLITDTVDASNLIHECAVGLKQNISSYEIFISMQVLKEKSELELAYGNKKKALQAGVI